MARMCIKPLLLKELKRPMQGGAMQGGYALVFVLAMLFLILAVATAFFSRAMIHREVGATSAAQVKTQVFAQTAADILMDDIQHEIEAGSKEDDLATADSPIRRPITLDYDGIGMRGMLAPGVAPQRVGDGSAANIVKVSRSGIPFFSTGDGYDAVADRPSSGLARASSISTQTAATKRRGINPDRWLKPRLMTDNEEVSFQAPDWIYVDRSGANPTSFSPAEIENMADSEPENNSFVIGRYAYVIYDVGGLIDINVVGNRLPAAENARRGRLNQVSLPATIGGNSVGSFSEFVGWRSPVLSTNAASVPGSNGVFDPKRRFLEVPSGDQAFVNRQELIAYADSENAQLTSAALPFLTTFSRDLNAPSYEPNSERLKGADPDDADLFNPALLSVRFSSETEINRPDGEPFTVPAETPVMIRRFPLSKLALFEEQDPDPDLMEYYFGLRRQAGSHAWEYTQATDDGRIKRLDEIADDRREPNFFEVLQAVIYRGSLGFTGINPAADLDEYLESLPFNKYTDQVFYDIPPQLQVMQIGANIIDQWDENDLPTTIVYPSGDPADPFMVYGIENLPYVSQIGLVGWRPTDNRDLFQVWAVFDVWNPHQNARTAPAGIDAFRIVPLGGTGRVIMRYFNGSSPEFHPGSEYVHIQSGAQNLVALNAGREFTFSSAQDYSEPTTLGNSPASQNDTPGLLIVECIPDDPVQGLAPEYGVKAYNNFRLRGLGQPPSFTIWQFALQARHSGDWHTYQQFEGFVLNQSDWASSPINGDDAVDVPSNTHHSMPDAPLENEFYTWRSRGSSVGMIKIDPRTNRLGLSGWSQTSRTAPGNDFLGRSIRHLPGDFPDALLATNQGSILNFSRDWAFPVGIRSVGREAQNPRNITPGFEVFPPFDSPPQSNRVQVGLFGFVGNNPEVVDKNNPARYEDPDGEIRPGDGYFGGFPTAFNQTSARPIILNRPFRSVGELGYVFRDVPWKTLDFSSRWSADLGLLDAFSISETDANPPLVAGPINLNTRQPETLAAALFESSRQLGEINPDINSSTLTAAQSLAIAEAIVAESALRPFLDRGDLITRVFHRGVGADPVGNEPSKTTREAAIRTLSEMGTTRTWNLMIDLIAQTGRFTKNSSSGADFTVQGESRVWIHVAIDRMTGKVLDVAKEEVRED